MAASSSPFSPKPPELLKFMFKRPPQAPLAGLASQLNRLGAEAQPAEAVATTSESTVLADVTGAGVAADVLALAFKVSAEIEGTRIQLRARDGSILDETAVPAGTAEGVLFMPPVTAYLASRTPANHLAKAELDAARLYALSPAATAPDKVALVGDLSRPFDWSRAYLQPDIADVGARLRARLFKSLTSAAVVPLVGGASILLEPGDELSRALFITGFYEPETMGAIRALLPKGGVFLDVGAHCGVVSLFAATLVGPKGRVLAFEPSRREYDRLVANVQLNHFSNVILSPYAVADVRGEATLLVAEAGHAGHNTTSQRFAYPAVKVADTVVVPTVTIDDVMAEHSIKRCDVIKMDIEGGELPALKGAVKTLRAHRPKLVLEMFDRAMEANATSIAELQEWLKQHDYELRDIDRNTGEVQRSWVSEPGISKNVVAMARR